MTRTVFKFQLIRGGYLCNQPGEQSGEYIKYTDSLERLLDLAATNLDPGEKLVVIVEGGSAEVRIEAEELDLGFEVFDLGPDEGLIGAVRDALESVGVVTDPTG
jgi:hypothetical protein